MGKSPALQNIITTLFAHLPPLPKQKRKKKKKKQSKQSEEQRERESCRYVELWRGAIYSTPPQILNNWIKVLTLIYIYITKKVWISVWILIRVCFWKTEIMNSKASQNLLTHQWVVEQHSKVWFTDLVKWSSLTYEGVPLAGEFTVSSKVNHWPRCTLSTLKRI